jgi:hypothetical protein
VRWPEVRGAAIAIAIGFGLVDGCPLPQKPAPWQRGLVDTVRSVQRIAEWPVAWIRPTLRVAQQWALFQAADRERFRMWIEGQRLDHRWELLYRAGDPEHDDDAELLEYRRVRGAWDPTDTAPGQYPAFASWITGRVLDRHPDFVAARVQMERIEIDAGGVVPTGQFTLPYLRVRGPK